MAQGVQQHFSGQWKGKSKFKLFSHYNYARYTLCQMFYIFQPVCEKLDEHGARQQLGAKGGTKIFISNLSWKYFYSFLFEGEKYIE